VTPSDRPPYPGLRPFERNETHLFFGRDGCVDRMIATLAQCRFLAVLGSSGIGKSSLVKTGLLSGLEMGLLSGAGSQWLIVDFRPGGDPLDHLACALLEAESAATKGRPPPDPATIANLRMRFKQEGPRELIRWCQEGHLRQGTNLLVLVDQFEELFRLQDDQGLEDAQAFVSLLLESRWPRGIASPHAAEIPIYVAITMRSEYLGACALIEGLAEAINEGTYLIPRMKRREFEEAIVGPARVCGIDIEPRLVTKLLNDMADFAPWDEGEGKDQLSRLARRADQLPLMQHALNQIWQRAREHHQDGEALALKFADYRGLEQELDEHAERVLGKLDASGQRTAECVFRAVTAGRSVADAIRRPTRYGDIIAICGADSGDAVADVITAFGPSGCQFLISDIRHTGSRLPAGALIDIAHESLIRQWKRLSTWLEKEGQAGNEWRRLKESADRQEVLQGHALANAVTLRKSKPTTAWAQRYGGELDKVIRLIDKSEWRRRARVTIWIIVVSLVAAYFFERKYNEARNEVRQANEDARTASRIADQTFALAVSSAQKLLDQVSKSFDHGDVTVDGAKEMLQVARQIVGDVRKIEATAETTELSARLLLSFSDAYANLGDYSLSYENAKNARDIAESLAADPNNSKFLPTLYASIWRMGDAIAFRSFDRANQQQALAEYLKAEDLARRLAEMAPGDGARQRELMFIEQKIGGVQEALGNSDAAIAAYQTALNIIEKVAAAAPENRSWRRDVANSRRRIGQALAAKNDFDGALEQFQEAIRSLTDLEKQDPTDNVAKSNLAATHRQIAEVYVRREDWTDASAEYAAAIAILERLNAADRNNATWQYSLANLYPGMGRILRRQNDLPGALEQYRKAYEIRQELALKDPRNSARQNNLAKAAIAVADVLEAQKSDLEEAVKLYRKAIEIQDKARPRHDDDVFYCYIKIGDIKLSQDDRKSALTEYTRAWEIANNALANNQASVAWRRRLTNSYVKIGDLLVKEDRAAEARAQYQEALKIVMDLAAKDPQNREWSALADSLKAK
jgi:tetratricopeptide (TPR) repeat protein